MQSNGNSVASPPADADSALCHFSNEVDESRRVTLGAVPRAVLTMEFSILFREQSLVVVDDVPELSVFLFEFVFETCYSSLEFSGTGL